MKATEQYFSVVLFIMLYKVVLLFESEILKSDHSNKFKAVLSSMTKFSDITRHSNDSTSCLQQT